MLVWGGRWGGGPYSPQQPCGSASSLMCFWGTSDIAHGSYEVQHTYRAIWERDGWTHKQQHENHSFPHGRVFFLRVSFLGCFTATPLGHHPSKDIRLVLSFAFSRIHPGFSSCHGQSRSRKERLGVGWELSEAKPWVSYVPVSQGIGEPAVEAFLCSPAMWDALVPEIPIDRRKVWQKSILKLLAFSAC